MQDCIPVSGPCENQLCHPLKAHTVYDEIPICCTAVVDLITMHGIFGEWYKGCFGGVTQRPHWISILLKKKKDKFTSQQG